MSGNPSAQVSMIALPAPATTKAISERFTGDVWVDGITDGAGPGCARLANVRFTPGARTAWHVHARGQTLHVTDGIGIVQSKAGQTILMRPGDTVYTPPGLWHWHGAMPKHFMTHLALGDSGTEPGIADVEWGKHVTDEEYQAAAGYHADDETATDAGNRR